MTSFGWKRKRPLQTKADAEWFSSAGAAGGEGESIGEEDEEEGGESGVDWLAAAKRRRLLLLEDGQAKSRRLKEEGALLAESERYWEAIKYWDEALQLTPGDAALYEMKAQVISFMTMYSALYMSLCKFTLPCEQVTCVLNCASVSVIM